MIDLHIQIDEAKVDELSQALTQAEGEAFVAETRAVVQRAGAELVAVAEKYNALVQAKLGNVVPFRARR